MKKLFCLERILHNSIWLVVMRLKRNVIVDVDRAEPNIWLFLSHYFSSSLTFFICYSNLDITNPVIQFSWVVNIGNIFFNYFYINLRQSKVTKMFSKCSLLLSTTSRVKFLQNQSVKVSFLSENRKFQGQDLEYCVFSISSVDFNLLIFK